MKHLIDIDTWERKDNYLFFRDFANSWIAMTGEVDCTEAYEAAQIPTYLTNICEASRCTFLWCDTGCFAAFTKVSQ